MRGQLPFVFLLFRRRHAGVSFSMIKCVGPVCLRQPGCTFFFFKHSGRSSTPCPFLPSLYLPTSIHSPFFSASFLFSAGAPSPTTSSLPSARWLPALGDWWSSAEHGRGPTSMLWNARVPFPATSAPSCSLFCACRGCVCVCTRACVPVCVYVRVLALLRNSASRNWLFQYRRHVANKVRAKWEWGLYPAAVFFPNAPFLMCNFLTCFTLLHFSFIFSIGQLLLDTLN